MVPGYPPAAGIFGAMFGGVGAAARELLLLGFCPMVDNNNPTTRSKEAESQHKRELGHLSQ